MLCFVEQTALRSAKVNRLMAVFAGNASQQRRHLASKTAPKKNYYQVLQISESATPSEIKAAFVKLSKELHPDKNPDNPNFHNKFIALNEAYTVLGKKSSRREYDLTLRDYKKTFTAQEVRDWQRHEVENEYRAYHRDPSYRNYYKGQQGGFRRSQVNIGFTAWATTLLLGLGTLYLYLGMLWVSEKLEAKRMKSVENYRILESVRERARGRSRDEVVSSFAYDPSRYSPQTRKTIRQEDKDV